MCNLRMEPYHEQRGRQAGRLRARMVGGIRETDQSMD